MSAGLFFFLPCYTTRYSYRETHGHLGRVPKEEQLPSEYDFGSDRVAGVSGRIPSDLHLGSLGRMALFGAGSVLRDLGTDLRHVHHGRHARHLNGDDTEPCRRHLQAKIFGSHKESGGSLRPMFSIRRNAELFARPIANPLGLIMDISLGRLPTRSSYWLRGSHIRIEVRSDIRSLSFAKTFLR